MALAMAWDACLKMNGSPAVVMAGSNLTSAFQTLYDLGGVSLEEMVRVLYRFIGEEGDPKEIVSQGTGVRNPDCVGAGRQPSSAKPNLKQPVKVDPETGELKGVDNQ